MAYEQRPGDISIFRETDKRNDRAPDWKGTMIVPEGVGPGDKLEVAVWAKGDRGTMLAGSVKPPRERQAQDEGDRFRGSGAGDMAGGSSDLGRSTSFSADLGDEIPFATPYSIR